jgi:hypothetical protein
MSEGEAEVEVQKEEVMVDEAPVKQEYLGIVEDEEVEDEIEDQMEDQMEVD